MLVIKPDIYSVKFRVRFALFIMDILSELLAVSICTELSMALMPGGLERPINFISAIKCYYHSKQTAY